MPNYNLSKPGDLRRWARETARGIEKELSRELRRRPAQIPVEVQQPRSGSMSLYGGSPVIDSSPVTFNVNGDGNQFAVGNSGEIQQQSVIQGMTSTDLVELIKQLRAVIPELGMDEAEVGEYKDAVDKVELESAKAEPNKGRLRRAFAVIMDFLRGDGAEIAKNLTPLVEAATKSLVE